MEYYLLFKDAGMGVICTVHPSKSFFQRKNVFGFYPFPGDSTISLNTSIKSSDWVKKGPKSSLYMEPLEYIIWYLQKAMARPSVSGPDMEEVSGKSWE